MSDPPEYPFADGASGLLVGDEGLMSESTVGGDIGVLTEDAEGDTGCPERLGVKDAARDMSSTKSGLMCFPSALA